MASCWVGVSFVLLSTKFEEKGEIMYLACSLHSHLETNQNNTNKHKIAQAAAPWRRWLAEVYREDHKTQQLVWAGREWEKRELLLSIKSISLLILTQGHYFFYSF